MCSTLFITLTYMENECFCDNKIFAILFTVPNTIIERVTFIFLVLSSQVYSIQFCSYILQFFILSILSLCLFWVGGHGLYSPVQVSSSDQIRHHYEVNKMVLGPQNSSVWRVSMYVLLFSYNKTSISLHIIMSNKTLL